VVIAIPPAVALAESWLPLKQAVRPEGRPLIAAGGPKLMTIGIQGLQ
jgi:hypothetical protein